MSGFRSKHGSIAFTAFLHPNAVIESPVDIADNALVYGDSKMGRYSYINVGAIVIERLFSVEWWSLPLSNLKSLPFDDVEACLDILEMTS